MFKNFKLQESEKYDHFVMNYFDYFNECDEVIKITPKLLAELVFNSIKLGLTKYNLDFKNCKGTIIRTINNRKNSSGIQSGYIGVDSEILYCGILEKTLSHKVVTRSSNLEYAEFGQDIITMNNQKINLCEVKSSTQSQSSKDLLVERILDGISSTLCKKSKIETQLYDIENELMQIADIVNFNQDEIEVVKKFIDDILSSEELYERIIKEKMDSNEIVINLLLVSKNRLRKSINIIELENQYIENYCSGCKKCNEDNRIIKTFFHPIRTDVIINLYHVQIDENLTNKKYYDELIQLVRDYSS